MRHEMGVISRLSEELLASEEVLGVVESLVISTDHSVLCTFV